MEKLPPSSFKPVPREKLKYVAEALPANLTKLLATGFEKVF